MENEKILVPDEGAENAEQTAEKAEKTYTEAEFNAKLDEVLGKKLARREQKIRKEYDRRYGDLEDVLKAGMGKEDMGEITEDLRKFYGGKGVKIDRKPEYSTKDIETLARAEADDIIRAGFDEVVEETDRLAEIGVENLNAREKAVFKALAEHRHKTETERELSSIGVTEDVYNSEDFKEFKKMFAPETPIAKIYETYAKTQPRKEIKSPGSMKSTAQDDGIKEYYSPEEAKRFTQAEINSNPALVEAIERSMRKWK